MHPQPQFLMHKQHLSLNGLSHDIAALSCEFCVEVITQCLYPKAVLLGGVYMTPGRLSRRSEFTLVPFHGSSFVLKYMIPPENAMPVRVTPT